MRKYVQDENYAVKIDYEKLDNHLNQALISRNSEVIQMNDSFSLN